MSEINYDQSGSNSDSEEVGELCPNNEPSKLKLQLFKPLASSSDEIEESVACNVCGNQAPSQLTFTC